MELGADGVPSAETSRVSVSTDLGPLPCPEWSPTGSHLAFFTGTELWVVDVLTGARTTFPVSPTGTGVADFTILDLEWSPDGSSIAVAEQVRIRSIPIDGTEPTELPAVGAWSLGWTADGKRLVYIDSDGAVHVADLDGNDERRLPADARWTREGSVVVSPDGLRVAYRRGDGDGVGVIDADGSKARVDRHGLEPHDRAAVVTRWRASPPRRVLPAGESRLRRGDTRVVSGHLSVTRSQPRMGGYREHLLAGGRPVTRSARRFTLGPATMITLGRREHRLSRASPLALRTELALRA